MSYNCNCCYPEYYENYENYVPNYIEDYKIHMHAPHVHIHKPDIGKAFHEVGKDLEKAGHTIEKGLESLAHLDFKAISKKILGGIEEGVEKVILGGGDIIEEIKRLAPKDGVLEIPKKLANKLLLVIIEKVMQMVLDPAIAAAVKPLFQKEIWPHVEGPADGMLNEILPKFKIDGFHLAISKEDYGYANYGYENYADSNQVCISQENFDRMLELALKNCHSNNSLNSKSSIKVDVEQLKTVEKYQLPSISQPTSVYIGGEIKDNSLGVIAKKVGINSFTRGIQILNNFYSANTIFVYFYNPANIKYTTVKAKRCDTGDSRTEYEIDRDYISDSQYLIVLRPGEFMIFYTNSSSSWKYGFKIVDAITQSEEIIPTQKYSKNFRYNITTIQT